MGYSEALADGIPCIRENGYIVPVIKPVIRSGRKRKECSKVQ